MAGMDVEGVLADGDRFAVFGTALAADAARNPSGGGQIAFLGGIDECLRGDAELARSGRLQS
jgi:hypothetical protein